MSLNHPTQTSTLAGFRLSPRQARTWTSQRHCPGYGVQIVLSLEGTLDQSRLKSKLQETIDKYDILRTQFNRRPGMALPLQVVESQGQIHWQTLDWTNLSPDEQQKQLNTQINSVPNLEETLTGLTVDCIQRTANSYWLRLELPALYADGTTALKLVQTWLSNYQQPRTVENSINSDDIIQYLQVSEWHHELLETEDDDYQAGVAYWQQDTLQQTPVSRLPYGLVAGQSSTWKPEFLTVEISPQEGVAIANLAKSLNVSLSSLFLTCWQALIARLSGDSQFLMGVALDGRSEVELEDVWGPLTRDCPLLTPDFNQSLAQAVHQVETDLDLAAQWQEYFNGNLETHSSQTAYNGYFPVRFQGFSPLILEDSGNLKSSLKVLLDRSDRFALSLSFTQYNQQLQLQFQGDRNVISKTTLNRLSNHYQTLLSAAIAQPHQPLNRLPLLTDTEQQELLTQFNPSPTPPSQDTLPQRIQQHVERTPDNIAVIAGNQQLTYGQLNQQANQLAHLLQQQGLQPDQPVGLYLNRTPNLIVGLLGILKAGGAYLPLDPSLPPKRLKQRLETAQVQHLVSETALQENLSGNLSELEMSMTHLDQTPLHQFSADNPQTPIQPQHLAYIIYTSGSSGKAKGVAIEHQQILSYIDAIIPQLQLPKHASYASVSTIAADLGNTAIFGALTQGGCLHLIDSEIASNPEAFAVYAQQHRIDCLKIVPSHLKVLLDSASQPQHLLPRTCLVLGGEASTWDLIQQIRSLSRCRIVNHYGPTETTVGVLAYDIPEPIPNGFEAQDIVPLGRPLSSSQVYILDEFQQRVPIGVPGELYLGGTTVARGYWRQPQLTEQRFLNFDITPGQLYRSGDLARYTPEGEIEFLGRQDGQVKLHGYRVELGEIEAVLRQHPQVDEALVLLSEDQQLRAYGLTHDTSLSSEQLRQFLEQRLPDYMVPGAIVLLSRWPLTANGKIDRQGLPEPELERSVGERRLPQTPTEQQLWQIWSEVLGSDEMGVDDNFFRLGGDSILSIQVVAKANQAGLMLTPKQMFEHQTIAELALVVGQTSQIPESQEPVTGAFPLTPIQSWFFEQDWCEPQHWNQAVLLSCGPRLRRDSLQETLQGLVDHHDGLRTRFVPTPEGWHGEILPPGTVTPPIDWIDGSDWLPSERSRRLQEEATRLQGSLKLDEGPLLRLAVFDWGEGQRQRLLIVIHHLLVDGVSWRILLEDFRSLYEGLAAGQRPQLPAKTTSISAWSQALLDYQDDDTLQQELEFWQTVVNQDSGEIPLDNGDNSVNNTVASEQRIRVSLTEAETQVLLQDVPSLYRAQIHEVLLAAVFKSFHDWTGQPSLFVNLEHHGREAIAPNLDLSRTVGWFTALYPLMLTLDNPDIGALIAQVKTQLRQVPSHGIGYGLLRYGKDKNVKKCLSNGQQPPVKFNYLGQFVSGYSAEDNALSDENWQEADEPLGYLRSPLGHRTCQIEIISAVTGGAFHWDWMYSQNLHHEETIRQLAIGCLDALKMAIAQAQNPDTLELSQQYTSSDFAEFQWSNWSQDDLDEIVSAIGDS